MSKKLLHKTLRYYLLFSVAVLLVSAPMFYFITNKLFIDEADEGIELRKDEFLKDHLATIQSEQISIWNKFNRDIKIEKQTAVLKSDSLFYRHFYDTLEKESEPYRVLYSPIKIDEIPYTLMVRTNLVESEDIILSVAILFLITLSVLLTGLYFITRRLSSHLWKPFYSTLTHMEHFEIHTDTRPILTENDTEEFMRLNQSVSKLLERNATAFKNQKEFIENAAHELQTPLAAFQAKLDMLAQKLTFTEEIGDTLSGLNDSLSRLVRLNKNLLLLSKMEGSLFFRESISVSDLLKRQSTFLEEQAQEKEIEMILDSSEEVTILADGTMLEMAISNLLLNAVRHNKEGGKIMISLNHSSLTVSNTSSHDGLDRSKLFKRFAFPGSTGGNGLGLAIVDKAAALHGWRVDYAYENQLHTFRLFF